MGQVTLAQVRKRLVGLNREQSKSVACSLIGHSRVVTMCFGYVYCARCGDQIADKLTGQFESAETAVVVGHDCDQCLANLKALTERDLFLVPKSSLPTKAKVKKAKEAARTPGAAQEAK